MTIMKKAMYFMVIAMLIVACQPNNEVNTPFEKGQKVILSATLSSGSTGAQQLPGKQRVSGKDNTTDIKLTWDKGDQIKVTVDGQDAVFTLIGEGGSAEGTFEGSMPADGTNYTVTYPVTYDESVLTSQTYVENGFDGELMKMTGEGTVDGRFTLTAQNALLGLQLTGSKALSDIVVTNSKTGDTYTLDCKGITLKSEATLFYLVIPVGEYEKGFKVEVLQDDKYKSLITDFEKTSTVTFTAGQAVVMPEKVADYELKTLTFEEGSEKFTKYNMGDTEAEITTWSKLIDNQQYGGELLYGYDPYGSMTEPYWWYDDNNTYLRHVMPDMGGFSYMYGGMAISNYTSDDYSSYDSWTAYEYQLTAYGTGGQSGSNFVMTNCGFTNSGEADPDANVPSIFFGDEEARVIDHMYVNNGTYALYSFENGDGYSYFGFSEDDWMKVVAIGLYDDAVVGLSEIYLYKGFDNMVTEWTKWDLSSLGKVNEVKFYIISSQSSFGANYFAYDDVAVRFPK